MPVLFGAVALLGLAVGSFLNVVMYSGPRGELLLHPASHCAACDHPVRTRHNLPVVGWLILRGRCADCDAPISVRYPAVELMTAQPLLLIRAAIGAAARPGGILRQHATGRRVPAPGASGMTTRSRSSVLETT